MARFQLVSGGLQLLPDLSRRGDVPEQAGLQAARHRLENGDPGVRRELQGEALEVAALVG